MQRHLEFEDEVEGPGLLAVVQARLKAHGGRREGVARGEVS